MSEDSLRHLLIEGHCWGSASIDPAGPLEVTLMQHQELVPFDAAAQRLTERHWLSAVRDHALPREVRAVVRASWERALGARVEPGLPQAPVALDEPSLELTRERTDWLSMVQDAIGHRRDSFGGEGHILTLFDREGRMLSSEGDPHALEGLAEINFCPGGLWAESAVGTNGPGTALATGAPVHIVGAEHFCQAWHPWHCAAVPIRDPATGEILGVLDISGFRQYAHPHSLNLAHALVVAIEQMLTAREVERRYLTLSKLADLATRYPGEPTLAVDRAGRVLCASPGVPGSLQKEARVPPELRATVVGLVDRSESPSPRQVSFPFDGDPDRKAVWYPVFDRHTPVGGCLMLEPRSRAGVRIPARGRRAPDTAYSFVDLVGESPAFLAAMRLARAAAATDLPVLLLGESGTGKELFAQAIHGAGCRRERPFIAVNCAALPRELIESELFGYVGGAFSGARRDGGIGKFEAADGGTIFLDEIAELPAAAQAALLRVLQEGEITKVGSVQLRRVNVRVIAATNGEIGDALGQGRLRADLYHRLNVVPIQLPALRHRRSDIPRLAGCFLADTAAELDRPGAGLAPEVIVAFERYDWPGNVRELRNTVRRLVAVAERFPITLGDLPESLRRAGDGSAEGSAPAVAADPELERLIEVVASASTMAEAARRLGITRSTLYRRMQRHGLRPERILRPR